MFADFVWGIARNVLHSAVMTFVLWYFIRGFRVIGGLDAKRTTSTEQTKGLRTSEEAPIHAHPAHQPEVHPKMNPITIPVDLICDE